MMWIGVWKVGASIALGVAVSQIITGVASWVFTALVARRLMLTALIILGGVPFVLLFDDWALELNGLFIAAGLGYAGWQWRKRR